MSASIPYSPDPFPAESYPPDAAAAAQETAALEPGELEAGERVAWWLALGGAVLGVVLGVAIMAWPEATMTVVASLFGIWLLVHGVVRIVQAITGGSSTGAERAIIAVIGAFFVVAGVMALRNLLVSFALLVTLVGLMWLIGGIMELVLAFGGQGGFRLWHGALGLLSIVAGLIVLVWPGLSLVTLVYITGIWLVVMGLIQVALMFWVRGALPRERRLSRPVS
jgi:uncharacterized membrane protein HdeD (DUF308 family)